MTRTQMTPKERRDAQIELRDMARVWERRYENDPSDDRAEKWRRAELLRAVANELDNVPEIQ